MGSEGSLMLLSTFLAFGVISIALYFLVLRPVDPNSANENGANGGRRTPVAAAGATANGSRFRARPQAGVTEAATAAHNIHQSKGETNIDRKLAECASFPVHLAPISQSICRTGGSNLLKEGLLTFRHTKAADYEKSQSLSGTSTGDVATQNRKERARVLSRMLALEGGTTSADSKTPPPRGSTFVISIPASEVSCPKLKQVLYLFATYYNLLVILVLPSGVEKTMKDVKEMTTQLRGKDKHAANYLATDILPDHRIVAASSAAGRIAFVRQLARAEIVLDFDGEVKTQLVRFGYRVINYKTTKQQPSGPHDSQLGTQLLS